MERIKGTLALLLELAALLLGGAVRIRRHPDGGESGTAREVLNQPPRPVRGDDGDTPNVRTPHW